VVAGCVEFLQKFSCLTVVFNLSSEVNTCTLLSCAIMWHILKTRGSADGRTPSVELRFLAFRIGTESEYTCSVEQMGDRCLI
jgi:hypothetical protein